MLNSEKCKSPHSTERIDGLVAAIRRRSEPHDRRDSLFVETPHLQNLPRLFCIIVLIDTNGVDPDNELFVFRSEVSECRIQVVGDVNWLIVDEESRFTKLGNPPPRLNFTVRGPSGIREGLVSWFAIQ
jgi:hypothetical protein